MSSEYLTQQLLARLWAELGQVHPALLQSVRARRRVKYRQWTGPQPLDLA